VTAIGILAVIGVALLALHAFGVTARSVSLGWLGAAVLALAWFWLPVAALFH
jgi:hypothetical protein